MTLEKKKLLKDLDSKEIEQKVIDLKKELILLKTKQKVKQKINLSNIKHIKYYIAKLLTIQTINNKKL